MPSANSRRNRRMRKAQAAQAQAIQKADQPDFRSVAVADVSKNHSIKKSTDLVLHKSSWDNCSLCNGSRCESVFKVGYCGCKFGYYCFEAIYMEECPTCPSKGSKNSNNAIDTFSRNVAGNMVEVGEFASLALQDWANSASNFVASPYEDPFIDQSASIFDFRPQPMNQRERDDVIRNVKIAKAVVGTAATLTGHLANGVGTCLWALGSVLSPVVREVSKKILTENNVDKERAERLVDCGMEIAKAAIISTGNVARGAQMGTGILASGVGRRLARNYERSCGFQPGELESHVGDIAQNAVHTAWNVRAIQPKSTLTKISRINPAPKGNPAQIDVD